MIYLKLNKANRFMFGSLAKNYDYYAVFKDLEDFTRCSRYLGKGATVTPNGKNDHCLALIQIFFDCRNSVWSRIWQSSCF